MEESVVPAVRPVNRRAPMTRKRKILRGLLVVAVLVLGYFTWQCGSAMLAGARLSDDAVRHFHSQLDSEAYGEIFQESDDAFQNSASRDEIVKFLAAVHSKLGHSRDISRIGVFMSSTPQGNFLKVNYQSRFDQGSAKEEFTWKKTNAGLKLVRYDVNSNVFVTR